MKQLCLNLAFCGIATLLIVLTPSFAYACGCDTPVDAQSAARIADVVFSGKVKSIGMQPSGLELYGSFPFVRFSDTSLYRRIAFEVREVWKGDLATDVNIVTTFSGTICGYEFKQGNDYLVYAYATSKNGFATGMCSRTRLLSTAKKDIADLGKGRLPEISRLLTLSKVFSGLAVVIILALSSLLIWRINSKSSDSEQA